MSQSLSLAIAFTLSSTVTSTYFNRIPKHYTIIHSKEMLHNFIKVYVRVNRFGFVQGIWSIFTFLSYNSIKFWLGESRVICSSQIPVNNLWVGCQHGITELLVMNDLSTFYPARILHYMAFNKVCPYSTLVTCASRIQDYGDFHDGTN